VRKTSLELGVVLGLVLAVVAIVGSNLIDGGHLLALVNPSAALLVVGGPLGATAVSSRWPDLVALPRSIADAFRSPRTDLATDVEQLVALAQKARREGLLSLEADLGRLDNPFLQRGLQMVIDGSDGEAVRSVLRTEMGLLARAGHQRAAVFETAGGFAPTMGIIGTVLGLVRVLGNLSNAGALGPSIATAFLATFYGISTANVFWLPLANRLHHVVDQQQEVLEVYLEGVLSIQAGDNPSLVREKLAVFLGEPKGQAAEGTAGAEGARPAEGRVA